jgi:hypothetical protein
MSGGHWDCLKSDAYLQTPKTAVWTCKDGRIVRICDMEDRHLLNTISMLERKATAILASEISAAYSCLAMMHGEMAQFYCELDIYRMEETAPDEFLEATVPIYQKLLAEKKRRGL